MKLVCISGSPRLNGNTEKLIQEFSDVFKTKNYEIITHHLNKLNYRGCQGCFACKTGGEKKCVLKDDLTPVFQDLEDADVVLLASPVYFGDITSQIKGFFDRLYGYLTSDFPTAKNKSRLNPGKTLVLGLVQMSPSEKEYSDIFPRYNKFFGWLFDEAYLIRECGCFSKKTIEKDEKRIENIRKIARNIL
jgi:multimeric flavodoxin WrbA